MLTVTLSAINAAPNNCQPRVITASVSGGSGNYQYFWSSNPPSSTNLGNGNSINVSPGTLTTYSCAVIDVTGNVFGTASIPIAPILQGSFDVFIPNAFTPNNDGINDTWIVVTSARGTGPINAYRYELNIVNRWGASVFSRNETISTGTTGIIGGQISWNGRVNGTGALVPTGTYNYSLRLINCNFNQLFNGTIQVIY